MTGDSCTDENPHWFPPFYGNWSDSTQGSSLTEWEGLGDKVAANKTSRGSMPPAPPQKLAPLALV